MSLQITVITDITHKLKNRNDAESMSLRITAITGHHSQAEEQEWDRIHESWNHSNHRISLTL